MYVVNGHDSAPGDWPWMVYIYGPINLFERGYICGGVLVNDQWVLTAAHCLFKFGKYEPNFEVSDTKMVFLKHQFTTRNSEEMWISAAEHHEHPGFHGNVSKPSYSPSYDVALVKLSIKLDLGGKHSKLRPVRLPISGHKMSHHDCTITGWGLTDAETMSRPWDLVLQEATVAILPHAECDQRLSDEGGLSEEKMCTVLVDGKGNGCNGDSGGPIQCRIEENGHDIWVLEGIYKS
ncbi:Serine protease 30 [Halotydeus destructor]|nr:Serine protease 30 [Halotydeus destructor]